MDPSVIIKGKVYLAKIKESESFGADDLLWGICLEEKGLLDFMGMQGLVKRVNRRGFFAPIISRTSMKWGKILELVKCQEMGKVGNPVTLFESPHTFKEFADFAYDMKILTEPEGQTFLNNLTDMNVEESTIKDHPKSKVKGGKSATKKASNVKGKPNQNIQERLALARKDAQMVVAGQKGIISLDLTKIHSQAQELQLTDHGVGLGQGEAQLVYGHPDIMALKNNVITSPGNTVLQEHEEVVVISPAVSNNADEEEGTEFTDNECEGEGAKGNDQNKVASTTRDMELEEIDVIIEELQETETGSDSLEECKKRGARYKSLTVSLRKKVEELKKANQELVRAATVHHKQMNEFKIYAAEEVVDGIKPILAPVAAITRKLDTINNEVKEMEKNINEQVKSNTVEMKEISEEVCSVKEAGDKGIASVLRTLSDHGLYSRKDSSDIPSAIMEILRLVRSMAQPSTTLLDDTDGNVGNTDQKQVSLTLSCDPIPEIIKDTVKTEGGADNTNTKEASVSQQKQHAESQNPNITLESKPPVNIFRPWDVDQVNMSGNRGGLGLLPTPAEFKYIENSFQGTREMSASMVSPPTYETPTKQTYESNVSTHAPRKQAKVTTLPGPVPAKLFQDTVNPSGTSHKISPGVQGITHPPGFSQATQPASHLTPKTLQQMGYKRVNGYIVRAEPSKPKKTRWS